MSALRISAVTVTPIAGSAVTAVGLYLLSRMAAAAVGAGAGARGADDEA